MAFSLVQGDLLPSMAIQLGAPAAIAALPTAQSVALLWQRPDGSVLSVPLSVTDPINGIVTRVWQPGDSMLTGEHRFQVVVTASNGETASDPSDGTLSKWWVYPRLSGPPPVPPPTPVVTGASFTLQVTCSDAGGCLPGAAVYVSGAATFARAEANALATTRVFGLSALASLFNQVGTAVIYGPLTLLATQWDAVVAGESGGLTPDATYYLSDTVLGGLTTVAPSTPGHFAVEVGLALSPTTMLVNPKTPIFL